MIVALVIVMTLSLAFFLYVIAQSCPTSPVKLYNGCYGVTLAGGEVGPLVEGLSEDGYLLYYDGFGNFWDQRGRYLKDPRRKENDIVWVEGE